MFLLDKIKRYTALAIIGNGFDMAHGYNTDYKSFVEKTSDPNLDLFRSYCENEDSITTWYLFEENIKILTEKMFSRAICYDGCNFSGKDKLRTIFKEIHNLLIQHLKNELLSKPIIKMPNIEKYLNSKTKVINFNYTKIAEEYTKNIFYVHGSLEENDIILGYDYRSEPCLFQYEDMCWSKTLCRKSLAFRRFLRRKGDLNSEKNKRLISSFESYQISENSSKGFDEKSIPEYKSLGKIMKKHRRQYDIPNINYKRISTIIVMGHGIEADQVFLKNIISKCTNLTEVIIFRYIGEDDISIKKKMYFFESYCKNIHFEYY